MNSSSTNWKFWLRAAYVRLRFLLFIATLAALFAAWPWLSAVADRWLRWSSIDTDGAVSSSSEFFCPMDPGVISDWPAICPICNMDLIRRSKSDAHILPDGALARMQMSPYKLTLAGIRTLPVEPVSPDTVDTASESTQPLRTKLVMVPSAAIMYWDRQPVVYVESMPGMFDAVPVKPQQRIGANEVVAAELVPGQRVVAVGALLLDAESRLRPNISTQYFGAAQQSALAVSAPELPQKSAIKPTTLSAADQQLVTLQQVCPVTQAELGSMGTPVMLEVSGRRVALCCAGCRARLQADPEKYLRWLDQRTTRDSAPQQ